MNALDKKGFVGEIEAQFNSRMKGYDDEIRKDKSVIWVNAGDRVEMPRSVRTTNRSEQ